MTSDSDQPQVLVTVVENSQGFTTTITTYRHANEDVATFIARHNQLCQDYQNS